MSLSFFIHFYGEAKHGAALCADAEARLKSLKAELGAKCSIILHSPLAVSGSDPLPVAQDERMLLCQLFLPDDRMQADVASEMAAGLSGLKEADGVRRIHSHVMTTEWLRAGSPDDPGHRRERFPSSSNTTAPPRIRRLFTTTTAAIMCRSCSGCPVFERWRTTCRRSYAGPAIGELVSRLQIVQAVFNSSDDFVAMRKSGERKEGLRDFENYPKFEGPVTHQVMDSRRID